MLRSCLSLLFLLTAAAACSAPAAPPQFHAETNPPRLADWGQVVVRNGRLELGETVEIYELNTPLFTDYALKLRTIWMPPGQSAVYREGDVLDFPVGTVITKTFFYPRSDAEGVVARGESEDWISPDGSVDLSAVRVLETRILVRRETGWHAVPYRWSDDQAEARLHRVGDVIPLALAGPGGETTAFSYIMPDVNQCASCHAPDSTTREIAPIGPKPRHLNRDFVYPHGIQNQLERLAAVGYLTGSPGARAAPRNADWRDADATLEDRARAYLDANCAHCHSPVGPADTSGLNLEPDQAHGPALGLCKPPIAAGSGTGDRRFSIVPGAPEESIMVYRLDSTRPDVMMPEIGRSTVHAEGVALIRDWIASLPGACG